MRIAATLAVTAVIALAGCGGKSTPAAEPPATTGTAASTPPAAPSPAGVQLGQARELTNPDWAVRATAYAYRTLKSRFPADRKGYVFGGLDAKVCLTKVTDPSKEGALSWGPWSIQFADDTTMEPVSSWSDDWFSVPLYPAVGKTVREGGCVRGWVLYEVPAGKRPVKVTYSPTEGGDGLLEWRV